MKTVGTFSFLSDSSDSPLNSELISELRSSCCLSLQDNNIVNSIIESINTTGDFPYKLTAQELNHLNHSEKKDWLKYLIYRYKFVQYPKEKTLVEFPVYILIEPTSVCNLRCVMCFQVDKTFTRQPYMGMMKFDLFQQIVDEAVEGGTGGITLASRGEPTLHKQLPQMLKYLSGKFYELKLTTNATLLNEKLIHAILESNVNIIVFSVDAHSSPLYEQIRVRGNFETVCRNIESFHNIREKYYPSSITTTRISAVKFRDDQNPKAFTDFWSNIVDEVGMKNAAARWDTYNNAIEDVNEHPCSYLWERLYIWHDGSTSPCDADYKSRLKVSSINNSSIKDVWLGERLQTIRQKHLESRRVELNPCDRCQINY